MEGGCAGASAGEGEADGSVHGRALRAVGRLRWVVWGRVA